MADDFFPEWLYSRQIDDDQFGAAYNNVSDFHRSCLKTNIARHQALYGFPDVTSVLEKKVLAQGGSVEIQVRPLDWCVFVLAKGYASAPRFLAVLMPALFSGVQAVAVVQCGSESVEGTILTACELAGVETVVALSEQQLITLVQDCSVKGHGAVLTLGTGVLSGLNTTSASQRTLKCWSEPVYHTVFADKDADLNLLSWAHPDMELICSAASVKGRLLATCAASADTFPDVPVRLGAGQEALFCWPGLQKDFFLARSVAFLA
ncbi:hypothetical protein [Oleidesulfovibrio sp.]|uniref:hypothetical protein n=1 Tax=Oleidesulfovibrio sp. TaxID=2909707 RepID=UPI003A84563F